MVLCHVHTSEQIQIEREINMMITNWYGVFTVLLASHSIVAMIAWIVGVERQDKVDSKVSTFMSREWLENTNTNTNKGEK
jgi:hypothetical protein